MNISTAFPDFMLYSLICAGQDGDKLARDVLEKMGAGEVCHQNLI
jgi:hypothetical protein